MQLAVWSEPKAMRNAGERDKANIDVVLRSLVMAAKSNGRESKAYRARLFRSR